MKLVCQILVAVVASATLTSGGAAQERLIVDTDWLAEHISDPDLILIHVGPADAYAQRHLPRAVLLDHSALMGEGHELTLELPDPSSAQEALREAGVDNESRVVVYHALEWVTPAARTMLTLEWIGLRGRVSMLDGGMEEWERAGYSLSSSIERPERGDFSADPAPRSDYIAFLDDVTRAVDDRDVAIVDARTAGYYDGSQQSRDPRQGHIPTAVSIPFTSLTDESNRLLPREELRRIFREAGVPEAGSVIVYCHVGQQASWVYLVSRLLDHETRLYDGSFQEWSRSGHRTETSN